MTDFNFKRTPLTDEMVIKGERFTKVDENKELDIYCYRREWKDRNGNLNHCFEIIKPVGKDRHYPRSEQFGVYGLCNTGAVLVHAIDYPEDKVLASINGENPQWCDITEACREGEDELELGFFLGSIFVPFCDVMRFYGGGSE